MILENISVESIDLQLLRVLDFFVIFPHFLKSISFPRGMGMPKKLLQSIPDPYENVLNRHRVMNDLGGIQDSAIHYLVAKGLLDRDLYEGNILKRTDLSMPGEITKNLYDNSVLDEPWFVYLMTKFHQIDFFGDKGMKFRTNLMEYRYDIS
jgi:hypothetical protein